MLRLRSPRFIFKPKEHKVSLFILYNCLEAAFRRMKKLCAAYDFALSFRNNEIFCQIYDANLNYSLREHPVLAFITVVNVKYENHY